MTKTKIEVSFQEKTVNVTIDPKKPENGHFGLGQPGIRPLADQQLDCMKGGLTSPLGNAEQTTKTLRCKFSKLTESSPCYLLYYTRSLKEIARGGRRINLGFLCVVMSLCTGKFMSNKSESIGGGIVLPAGSKASRPLCHGRLTIFGLRPARTGGPEAQKRTIQQRFAGEKNLFFKIWL